MKLETNRKVWNSEKIKRILKKKKLVVFHPAIAPYRVDFFNSLNKEFDAIFYFEFGDVLEQSFAQDELRGRLEFVPRFLASGYSGLRILGHRFSQY